VDLAEGNLTVRQRVYGRDEIAETSRALDTSIRNLNTTLKTILASAQSIDSARVKSRRATRCWRGARARRPARWKKPATPCSR
jgi:methyl-accepting chemotaxis protein